MKLNKRKTFTQVVLCTFLLVVFLPVNVEAGIFKLLMKAGDEVGDAGSKVGRKLDDVLPGLSRIPDEPGVTKIGVDFNSDGTIKFIGEGDQKWTLKQGDDASELINEIKKSQGLLKAGNAQQLKIYLSPDQLFTTESRLLKEVDGLHLLDDGKALPIKTVESAIPSWTPVWSVKVQDNLHLKVNTPQALEEGLWQINKTINKSNIRLVSFVPDLDDLPSGIQATTHGSVPDLTMINPAYLDNSLNVLRHQTLVVTGKRVGGVLEIKGVKGKTSSIDLNELQSISLKHDINLIVLESTKPAQLGTSIFPWNKSARQADLEKAFSSETYGEFFSALSGKNKSSTFQFEQKNGNFVSFRNSQSDRVKTVDVDHLDDTSIGADVLIHSAFTVGRIVGHNKEYDREMNNRVILWIPTWVQTLYFINILASICVIYFIKSGFTIPLWKKIWPKKDRDEYRSIITFLLVSLLRFFCYIFILFGLFGTLILLFLAVKEAGRILLVFFKTIFKFLRFLLRGILWPFRFVIRLLTPTKNKT